jgi:hypothetical protein
MMNDLIAVVSQKTGLSPDQAETAVEAVIGMLKQRLPAPVAGVLSSMVHGGQSSAAAAGSAESAGSGGDSALAGLEGEAEQVLGNLFGGKKEN